MSQVNRMVKNEVREKQAAGDVAKMLRLFSLEKRRDFPWRCKQTAYRVLVSELMLQQTQVGRVVEKYEPFLKKFPSLAAVQKASLASLLLEWKGLGYMRRIKALKQISMETRRLPKEKEKLTALPGIGDYTGGAVCAFAYDVFTPILETNIRTVLCYHFCPQEEGECCVSVSYKELLPPLFLATKLSARTFYEAMMDYGAELKKEKVIVCKTSVKQKAFKGSKRELRAKLLYLITEKKEIGVLDERSKEVLSELVKEEFVVVTSTGYEIAP